MIVVAAVLGLAADVQAGPGDEVQPWEARVFFEPVPADPAAPLPDPFAPAAIPTLSMSGVPVGVGAPEADEPDLAETLNGASLLDSWGSPGDGVTDLTDGQARFSLEAERTAPVDSLRARTDRWATGLFSRDAALLTPLAPGREFLTWALTERLTLASVASPRVWDYRERAFVVSAEAGLKLSPTAGLHVGYELLQATTVGGFAPDVVGGESLFARFQVRF